MSMEMTGKSSPRVSVIIPLYNHEQYISETVGSVLRQTFEDFELIVIDDGSTDRSAEIVKNITDVRIRYYSQKNQGAHSTINRGISLARGKYVGILNSDDLYDSKRLEECLRVLERDAALQAVFSHVEFINDSGEMISVSRGAEDRWSSLKTEMSFQSEHNTFLDLMTGNFLVTTSNLFCRRSVFDAIGVFSALRYAHDYEFFLRLTYNCPVYMINKAMVKYRIHEGNTIKENEAAVNFEVGLVLFSLFLRYDMKRFLPSGEKKFETLMKLFHSLNTLDTDRMILALLFYTLQYGKDIETLVSTLSEDPENVFRKDCIRTFNSSIDLWHSSQKHAIETEKYAIEMARQLAETSAEAKKWWLNAKEGWAEVEAIGLRLTETERQLAETSAEAKKWWLNAKEGWAEVSSLKNSFVFRLYRVFTLPMRILRSRQK